jgi:hypothetical protein
MVQLHICASNGHELFTTLLHLDASFVMTPHAISKSIPYSNRVLRPKPKKPSAGGFETQTSKPLGEVYPLCLLHDLDMCHLHP